MEPLVVQGRSHILSKKKQMLDDLNNNLINDNISVDDKSNLNLNRGLDNLELLDKNENNGDADADRFIPLVDIYDDDKHSNITFDDFPAIKFAINNHINLLHKKTNKNKLPKIDYNQKYKENLSNKNTSRINRIDNETKSIKNPKIVPSLPPAIKQQTSLKEAKQDIKKLKTSNLIHDMLRTHLLSYKTKSDLIESNSSLVDENILTQKPIVNLTPLKIEPAPAYEELLINSINLNKHSEDYINNHTSIGLESKNDNFDLNASSTKITHATMQNEVEKLSLELLNEAPKPLVQVEI